MEVLGQVFADKPPVPRLKNVVGVILRIRERKAVLVGVLEEPGVGLGRFKGIVWARSHRVTEVEGGTELVL